MASRNHRAIDAVEERLRALGPGWFLRLSSPDGVPAPDWQQLCQTALAQDDRSDAEKGIARLAERLAELDGERLRLLGELDRHASLADRYAAAEAAAERLAELGIEPGRLRAGLAPLLRPSPLRSWAERLPVLGAFLRARRRARMLALLGGGAGAFASAEEQLSTLTRLLRDAAERDRLARELRALGEREAHEERLVQLAADIRAAARARLATGPPRRLDDSARKGLRALLDELQLAEATGDQRRARRAWRQHGRHLLDRVPVVAVTNLSAASRLPLVPRLFSLLVIDEASQCDIPSALPLFARAERAVVVGDPMQLRHVSRVTPAREAELLRQQGLPLEGMAAWFTSVRSLFDLAERCATSRHFLAEHYRCHPEIASYVSRAFYDGRLHPLTPLDTLVAVPGRRPGIHWEDVSGEVHPARSGCHAPAERDAVLAQVDRLLAAGFSGTIGIASPFREQATRLGDALAERFSAEILERHRLVASSVHQFQGDARDVVLVSLCLARNTPAGSLEFLRREARLLNVAISRARVVCVVFGDRSAARACGIPHVTALLDQVERRERARSYAEAAKPFQSPWEERLYEALRSRGLRTVPQFPLAGRFLDLAVPEVRLDIEVDGDHHRGPDGRRRSADRWRDVQVRSLGWNVLRFWVYQLREDLDGCIARILARVGELQEQKR